MKQNKIVIFLGVLLLSTLAGCKFVKLGNGNSSAKSVKFTDKPVWKIQPLPGQSDALEILVGPFDFDSYPDLVLVTETGSYFYRNDAGKGWKPRTTIAAFSIGTPTYVLGTNLISKGGIWDLIAYFESSHVGILKNLAKVSDANTLGTFSLQSSLFKNAQVNSMAYGSGIFAATSSIGNHFYATVNASGNFVGGGTAWTAEGSGKKVLSRPLDGDSRSDFVYIPENGNVGIEVYRNVDGTSLEKKFEVVRSQTSDYRDAALANLSGDARWDLLVATDTGFEFFQGEPDFKFQETNLTAPLSLKAKRFVLAPITADSTLDIFAATDGKSVLYSQVSPLLFQNVSSVAFGGSTQFEDAIWVSVADLNQDGKLDLLELFIDGTILVHMNEG